MIFSAVAGPIPGKVSKSSFVAVFILIKLEDELSLGLLELASFILFTRIVDRSFTALLEFAYHQLIFELN